jgi:hypothetical protein
MERITVTFGVTTTSESIDSVTFDSEPAEETVTLYHGSALVYCNEIATSGLDYDRMKEACPGAFAHCTSVSLKIASGYASMNPLVYTGEQPPAVVKYNLPLGTIQEWLANRLVGWVREDQAYEFRPETFVRIYRERTSVSVIPVTSTMLTFDE